MLVCANDVFIVGRNSFFLFLICVVSFYIDHCFCHSSVGPGASITLTLCNHISISQGLLNSLSGFFLIIFEIDLTIDLKVYFMVIFLLSIKFFHFNCFTVFNEYDSILYSSHWYGLDRNFFSFVSFLICVNLHERLLGVVESIQIEATKLCRD